MKKDVDGLLVGSFIGDAIALRPHWIYDLEKLVEDFSDYNGLPFVGKNDYHPTKASGDFTHYGDQAYLLLSHLRHHDGYRHLLFMQEWIQFMESYEGYMDKACKDSLPKLKTGYDSGSTSSDLGGLSVLTPLLQYYIEDPEKAKTYGHQRLAMTHDNKVLHELLDDLVLFLEHLQDSSPAKALIDMRSHCSPIFRKYMDQAIEWQEEDEQEAVKALGQSCDVKVAMPLSLFLIFKYEHNVKEALLANVKAGGDSAARGMIIGMILGYHHGLDAFPTAWTKLNKNI